MNRTAIAAALAAALLLPAAAKADDAPGVFKVPGTDSTIKFYGYVQFDATAGLLRPRRPTSRTTTGPPSCLASRATTAPRREARTRRSTSPARTSRFGIQTSTPSASRQRRRQARGRLQRPERLPVRDLHQLGPLPPPPRLRHGRQPPRRPDLDHLPRLRRRPGHRGLQRPRLAGPRPQPDDPLHPPARQRHEPGPGRREHPRPAVSAPTRASRRSPTCTPTSPGTARRGSLSARGVTQRLQPCASGTDDPRRPSQRLRPSAGAVSGSVKIGSDTVLAQFAGGPGIGRYLLNAGAPRRRTAPAIDGNRATLKLWTRLRPTTSPTPTSGAPEFRSTSCWSLDLHPGSEDRRRQGRRNGHAEGLSIQAFVNPSGPFAKNAEFGVEYAYGQWKSFGPNELKGTQNRVNACVHYNFY